MVRKQVFALLVLVLFLVAVSCKRLEEVAKPMGPLTYEPPRFADAIPQDYGTLVGVTQSPSNQAWVGLWFQKSDGTVIVVPVNTLNGRLGDKVLKIPRK